MKDSKYFQALLAVALGLSVSFLAGCAPGDSDGGGGGDAGGDTAPGPSYDPIPGLPDGFPATPDLSGVIPTVVSGYDPDAPNQDMQPFFDRFSWQSFVALSWPASDQRGQAQQPNDPDVFLNAQDGAQPVVWSTYRESFELFGQGSGRPPAWESSDTGALPCENTGGKRVFAQVNKGGTLLDEVNEAFSSPLIDQAKNYVYYEVRFNEAEYDFIRGPDDDPSKWLYLSPNLQAAQRAGQGGIVMPASTGAPSPYKLGSLMTKAGWRLITPDMKVDKDRFYRVEGLVYTPETAECEPAELGLVALHIVQKLETFPQWIWSTFEQVDNVPGTTAGPYSFNNGTDSPSTAGHGWDYQPQKVPPLEPKNQRTPVQVTRLNPMLESTPPINQWYQRAVKGTVWQHYQLVVTQWPTKPDSFALPMDGGVYPSGSGDPAPQDGAVNPAAETYVQSAEDAAGATSGANNANSCMACHYGAADTDFSWVLKNNAHLPDES